MAQRTTVDFSKHVLEIIQHEGVLIHKFKKPNTSECGLTFINTCGVMTVTGDFSNWVFCKEFHPCASEYGRVSDNYWDEKLRMYSKQKAEKYSAEETMKSILDFEENFQSYYGREMDEDELEWVVSLKDNHEDEIEYNYIAYRDKPSEIEYESVPYGEKRHPQLDIVYDAFEAICKRLKAQKI